MHLNEEKLALYNTVKILQKMKLNHLLMNGKEMDFFQLMIFLRKWQNLIYLG